MFSDKFNMILFPQSALTPPLSYSDALQRHRPVGRALPKTDRASLADLAKQPGLVARLQAIMNPAAQ